MSGYLWSVADDQSSPWPEEYAQIFCAVHDPAVQVHGGFIFSETPPLIQKTDHTIGYQSQENAVQARRARASRERAVESARLEVLINDKLGEKTDPRIIELAQSSDV